MWTTHREHGSSLLPDGQETMLPPLLFTSTRESSPNTHSQSMVFPLRTSHVIGSLSFPFWVNKTNVKTTSRERAKKGEHIARCYSGSHTFVRKRQEEGDVVNVTPQE